MLCYRDGIECMLHRESREAHRRSSKCSRSIYYRTMLYFIETRVNSSYSHILMVSEPAPHDNGAEVPIAGAHVLLEGQGVGADRQKPREDARMTMSREPGSRLLAYGRTRKSIDFLPCQHTALLCSPRDLSAGQVLRRSGDNVCSHVVSFASQGN
jgi:hypothetical protein